MNKILAAILIAICLLSFGGCKSKAEKLREQANISAEKAEKSRHEVAELESLYDDYQKAYSNFVGN